jgi:ATP-dependent Zn protease
MKTAIRRSSPALAVLPLALVVLALAASAAPAAVHYVDETYHEYETQLKEGQIREAVINKRLRTIRITLSDGRHVRAQYPRHEEPHVMKQLHSHHVIASVLSEEQAKKEQAAIPVHHKLRYIIGGVGIAVIVIVGGVVLYNRRRRAASEQR